MEKLDELLKLEKAANLVCVKYDKMANAYEQQSYFVGKNDIGYDELQKKYKKCNKIHSKIIDDIETFLDKEELGNTYEYAEENHLCRQCGYNTIK